MKRSLFKLVLLGFLLFGAPISLFAVTIDPNDPLVPNGLGPGDRFHFAFVTSPVNTIDSLWTITQLNTHVNDVANDGGGYSGSLVARLGYTWYAIASDTTVDARDNALVSAPVYRIDGEQLASGYSDMWDGTIGVTLTITEKNTTVTDVVRTGSRSDGTAGQYPFGNAGDGRISRGQNTFTSSGWIEGGSEGDGIRRHAYVLSEEIKVASHGLLFSIK